METTCADVHSPLGAMARDDHDTNRIFQRRITRHLKTEAKDPICGMTVDTFTALRAERDGETFYFCSEHCRENAEHYAARA